MNKKMLQKIIGKKVRIRPTPYELTMSGLKIINEPWFVEKGTTEDSIEISNSVTGHSKQMGFDHVKEFMTDPQFGSYGILILKSQIIIDGNTVLIEPIVSSNVK